MNDLPGTDDLDAGTSRRARASVVRRVRAISAVNARSDACPSRAELKKNSLRPADR